MMATNTWTIQASPRQCVHVALRALVGCSACVLTSARDRITHTWSVSWTSMWPRRMWPLLRTTLLRMPKLRRLKQSCMARWPVMPGGRPRLFHNLPARMRTLMWVARRAAQRTTMTWTTSCSRNIEQHRSQGLHRLRRGLPRWLRSLSGPQLRRPVGPQPRQRRHRGKLRPCYRLGDPPAVVAPPVLPLRTPGAVPTSRQAAATKVLRNPRATLYESPCFCGGPRLGSSLAIRKCRSRLICNSLYIPSLSPLQIVEPSGAHQHLRRPTTPCLLHPCLHHGAHHERECCTCCQCMRNSATSQAVAVAQRVKTSSLAATQSLSLVKNLMRLSVSTVCYLRGLFDDDAFTKIEYMGTPCQPGATIVCFNSATGAGQGCP